jgi:hypothetical protein
MKQTNLHGETVILKKDNNPKQLNHQTRKKLVKNAIYHFGGKATLHQISDYLGLNANGISQTLSSMPESRYKYDIKLKKGVYSLE